MSLTARVLLIVFGSLAALLIGSVRPGRWNNVVFKK